MTGSKRHRKVDIARIIRAEGGAEQDEEVEVMIMAERLQGI